MMGSRFSSKHRPGPGDPLIGVSYFYIGRWRLLQSRTDEAMLWLEKARAAPCQNMCFSTPTMRLSVAS